MSFIPHRDVFNMTKEEVSAVNSLFDEIEARYLDDWAREEIGQDWTWKRFEEERKNYCGGMPTISGYDMLVYVLNIIKEKRIGI